MGTVKEEAQAYQPPQTKNIADLKEVGTDFVVFDREGKDKDGNPFKYKVIDVDGEEYRVPGKVLGDIKEILEVKPNLKKFKVNKKGSGLNTQYTVVQLD